MAMVLLWTLLWLSGYYHRLSAEMLVQYKYFLSGEGQWVSLLAPAETSGTEFIWEWTSHDGSYTNTRIITIQSDGKFSWNLPKAKESISKGRTYDIYLRPVLQNAGVYTFIQTKQEKVNMFQFEVFAVKVEPSRWSSVKEGSDVIRSCEVSHLPDLATLDWERDREPTANTTLIYNNTAHIIIHSADRYSEGTYNCTLRWNGALIFSIPRTLQVYRGTYGTHTLYRGSLNSSEVVLICCSTASYRTAYWRWEPSSETNALIVASADKYENALISMEIDKERFSSERYDGSDFSLRISPVKFGDSGRYICHFEHWLMATVTLVTVQVSAVPSGGLSRNQSVVLNCEISHVIDSVTLAWLRMKGGRGELVKQEVLSEEHPKKMLSLNLPILSTDQLHWVCAVFTESMLRAQVPLHLTLLTPVTEPEESKPVLVQYKYFLSGEGQRVSLLAPAGTKGTEFIWEWTSHDGSYTNARILTIQSDGEHSWNLWKAYISKHGMYNIYLEPELQNAGVFTFIQTKPENVKVAQFEVFAAEVKPSRWSSVKEGSDVIRSCEVSHLPDSATLDWERDTEPTAYTTLIYNNTAHIIIHSADRSSEGTYNCTLRWNGALIFSISTTLQVYKSTYRTHHTLYRGSLSSSEVVLICRDAASYRTAYWLWEPLAMTNAIIVASADEHKNASISMEIDNERFSSERYDGYYFPLRISPVKFGDSGKYFCHFERQLMATVTLVTVQVSTVPPGGLSRNLPVVLNCEISQVIGSVTLAWLRMKGGRGELVKQEVLNERHPKKMLSLTLPILSRDQLHWTCAVFTESMLRAQVPLHLTLLTPITGPEEPKPAVLVQYKYFLSVEGQGVSLLAPAETNGTEFTWEWTSHDGSYTNARIITIQSDGKHSWNLWKASISKQGKYGIYLEPELQNAGVFTFIQTKPESVKVAQFEVFAAEVKPSRWSSVKEGSDVTMSCEVSHLPDSATLDWERDREPTANTMLIYNNTAHVIIHSADRYSEGTHNCTLRWNGALIFSIPRTLQVYKSTYGTEHTLYRGSLNSSEVVLICRDPASYGTAYWQWEPSSGTNSIRVASADKYENASISMEIDKERFSSERYDGSDFPLRISPVKFGDSGRYFCHFEHWLMATVTLVTVQVSAVPPGGLSRNQSVVLTCEISQAFGNVTLAWLWMKGGRGELVKQEVLSERHPKKMLSLTLPILSRDQLHWACAVFTESMLRAQVPLHLTLPKPITEPEKPKPDNGRMLVIGLACTAAVCVGVLLLLGGLLFRRLKTAAGPSTSPAEGNGAADTVYSDVTDLQRGQVDGNGDSSAAAAVYSNVAELQKDQGNQDTPKEENESEELQYLIFSLPTPSLDPHRQQRRQLNPQSRSEQEENYKVVYASICTM